ncbi:neural proliferation differentiation and control protein 1-like isoform X2 [Brienomyrus brachyistius]|uniref:neural proliferation differentiation and control protein 1-like isoform X2 n=1 Tax=Brienomyrus brachyistius TaxID=42636 RepID=UPI0020B37354|nr:neural proliferation differentiation and control protein 1-like isoform X2 [Brienomyrus brachyistius]
MLCPNSAAEIRPRRSFLPGLLLCAALLVISGSMPMNQCPRSLDCAREGRHFCQPGSSHCGPCLVPLVENDERRCVLKKRHTNFAKVTSHPELDEEIDFLSSIIAKQRSEVKQSEPEKRKQSITTPVPFVHPGVDPQPTSLGQTPEHPAVWREPVAATYPSKNKVLTVMTAAFSILGTLALTVVVACWIRLRKGARLAQKVDYPAFGLLGSHTFDSTLTGDKKLAHSAQMYHYQQQKQQMLSLERHRGEHKVPDSGTTSDEENEDGDFTVYECPGLAPTGEMEVRNPLFDDSTLTLRRNEE